MNNETIRARIEEIGIIPAIRLSSANDALFAVKAVADCGIPNRGDHDDGSRSCRTDCRAKRATGPI